MRRCIGLLAGIFAVLVIAAIALVYSGAYNVSAAGQDSKPVAWLIGKISDRSIQRRARGIRVPDMSDPRVSRLGFAHYRRMCVVCHGDPGMPDSEIARGLNPRPPKLADFVDEWKPNELFWITKNGIRMTGMPAWGVTHSDEEIWAMVSFMRKLPSLTAAQYRTLESRIPPAAK